MAQPPPFEVLREFFEDPEGGHGNLCEVIVRGAELPQWEAFVALVAERYEYRYAPDSATPEPLSREAALVLACFTWDLDEAPSLGFHTGELEAYIRPGDLCGGDIEVIFERAKITRAGYAEIGAFMQALGDATGLHVYITDEGGPPCGAGV